jgi:hypothetical protein
MKTDLCTFCATEVKNYNSIMMQSEDGYIRVCLHCYNRDMAESVGIDYDHIELQPISLEDIDGDKHIFQFTVRLMGDELVLKAQKDTQDDVCAYEFSMIGDYEDGLFSLFSRLYERMVNTLNTRHVYKDPEIGKWQVQTNEDGEDIVRGRIEPDTGMDDSIETPLIVVDGKKIPWKDFGRMLMTFEGFNFKLQLYDPSDDMD